jgi:hypothetical protein
MAEQHNSEHVISSNLPSPSFQSCLGHVTVKAFFQ